LTDAEDNAIEDEELFGHWHPHTELFIGTVTAAGNATCFFGLSNGVCGSDHCLCGKTFNKAFAITDDLE